MEIGSLKGRFLPGLLLAGAVMLITGCGKPPALPAPPPPGVTVAMPLDREVMEWDEFPGRLEATETVELRARVSGNITSVSFKEGGIVNKGDLLFVIDPRPYQAELDRALGEVARGQARLALAQTEFTRTERLVPTQAASELELDEKRANLDEAKAAISVAEANVKAARLNVEFTEVRAPLTGRISRIFITAGNWVTGGQAQATQLTTITSLDPIYCYFDADERSVLKYQRLAGENKRLSARTTIIPCKLSLLNEETFEHAGIIDFVDNRVDPTTGTLRARGLFPNPDGVMTPGLFGRVRVPGAAPYRTLLVAESAVQNDQGKRFVLTLNAEDTVTRTYIEIGTLFGNLRAVTSGLNGEERIIVNGLLRARPGGKVKPEVGPMPGGTDAETIATTRVVEPTGLGATTQPTTAPATQPSSDQGEPASTAPVRVGVAL
jgi:RND family efflux transporter MFP subunit